MEAQQQTSGWHIANWGFWGYLETAVKSIGILAGFIALLTVTSTASGSTPNYIAAGLVGLLLLITLAALAMRLQQREVISLIFAVANVIGHGGMLFFLLQAPETTTLALIFGAAFAAGEVIKLRFLSATGYTESGPGTSRIFVGSLIALYSLLAILTIV